MNVDEIVRKYAPKCGAKRFFDVKETVYLKCIDEKAFGKYAEEHGFETFRAEQTGEEILKSAVLDGKELKISNFDMPTYGGYMSCHESFGEEDAGETLNGRLVAENMISEGIIEIERFKKR